MGKYNTIIFDMDGTLLDTLDDLTNSVNFALKQFGMKEFSKTEIKMRVGNGVRTLLSRVVPDGEKNPQFEDVFTVFKKHYGEHCNDMTAPYEGICELLQKLKQEGYSIAIVSNKLDSAVKDLCNMHFKGLVDVAVGERDGIARKPAPDMILAAMDELGQNENDKSAVYIGDSEVDLETARQAGLPCVSVLWGFRDRDFLEEQGAMLFAVIPEDVLRFL